MKLCDILGGPFADHSKDTPLIEIERDRFATVLRNWARSASFNLPGKDVAEMLRDEADRLS